MGKRRQRAHEAALGKCGVVSRSGGQRVPCCLQPWMSDAEESPFLDPALRKRAVKVKHVKRREKKSEKKVMERVKRALRGEAGARGVGRRQGPDGERARELACRGRGGPRLTSAAS